MRSRTTVTGPASPRRRVRHSEQDADVSSVLTGQELVEQPGRQVRSTAVQRHILPPRRAGAETLQAGVTRVRRYSHVAPERLQR